MLRALYEYFIDKLIGLGILLFYVAVSLFPIVNRTVFKIMLLMIFVIMLTLCSSCGGTYKHKAEGNVTVKHEIDLKICEQLESKELQVECIKTLLELLKDYKNKE